VINAIQEVIHAFGAQCTLDSFSFNAKGELQYRGHRCEDAPIGNARRELF